MPDLWKSSSTSSFQESSVFKSNTKRLDIEDVTQYDALLETQKRQSLERERSRNLGKSPSFIDSSAINQKKIESLVNELQMGERGMQNIGEEYLLPSSQIENGSSHILNVVDSKIRRVQTYDNHQYTSHPFVTSHSADSYDPAISLSRSNKGSPNSRYLSPSSRPTSPTQEAIQNSRQPGFSFTAGNGCYDATVDNGFKVFLRDQLSDGTYTIRPVRFSKIVQTSQKSSFKL